MLAPPPSVLRRRLRDATAAQHEQTERLLDAPSRCVDLARYCEMVRWLAAVHGPLEVHLEALDARLRDDLDTGRRHKAGWLRADLDGLDAERDRDTPPWLGRVRHAMARVRPRTAAEAVGVQYVVEGSMLGGRVLADIAGRQLGVGTTTGGRFLHGYGAATGNMWRDYWRHGAACLHTRADMGAAERSARIAFDAVTVAAAALTVADRVRHA